MIEDGLSVLRLARGVRVAMNVNVLDLTERILRAHLDADPTLAAAFQVDNRCRATYPERPFWLQFGETDFDYLRRVWAMAKESGLQKRPRFAGKRQDKR